MPSNLVHGKKQEAMWDAAKAIAESSKRKKGGKGARNKYALANHVFQQEREAGKVAKSDGALVMDLKKALYVGGGGREAQMPKPTLKQAAAILQAGKRLEQGMFDPEARSEGAISVLCDQICTWAYELCRETKVKAAKAIAHGSGEAEALADEAQVWDDAAEMAYRVKDELRRRRRERETTSIEPLLLTKSTDNAYVTPAARVLPAWLRPAGAAATLRNHAMNQAEKRYVDKLHSEMPRPQPLISDGNYNTPADVVKGLGMPAAEESMWAQRITRLVGAARIETDLRKSIFATMKDYERDMPKFLRAELARRTLQLYRDARRRGGGLAKALPPGQNKPMNARPPAGGGQMRQPQGRPPQPGQGDDGRVNVAPPGKDVPGFEDGEQGGTPEERKAKHFTDPAVDVGDLEGGPVDPGIITTEIEHLHQQLHALHSFMDGSPAQIHLHNDLVKKMRECYAKPTPDGLREIKHALHHFSELVQGPQEPQPDPDMAGEAGAGMGPPNNQPAGMKQQSKPQKKPQQGGGGPPMMQKSQRLVLGGGSTFR